MRHGMLAGIAAVSCLGFSSYGMAQTEPVPMPNSIDHNPPHVAPVAPQPPGLEFEHRRRPMMRPEFARPEHVTWIGVGVSPVSPLAEHQLKLPPGVGLVVDDVAPDSPAAKAGLAEYDILQKLDDQLLVNPEQLATLVRMHKAGEEITLTVIHEGKPNEVKVTLAEHMGPPMMMPMMPGTLRFHGMAPGDDREPPHAPPADGGRSGPPPKYNGHTELHILPNVELQLSGVQPQVIVKDAAGNTLFSKSLNLEFDTGKGPVNVHVQVGASAHNEEHHDADHHEQEDDDKPKGKQSGDDKD